MWVWEVLRHCSVGHLVTGSHFFLYKQERTALIVIGVDEDFIMCIVNYMLMQIESGHRVCMITLLYIIFKCDLCGLFF